MNTLKKKQYWCHWDPNSCLD